MGSPRTMGVTPWAQKTGLYGPHLSDQTGDPRFFLVLDLKVSPKGKHRVLGSHPLLPEDLIESTDFPLYLSNRLRVEYLLFPSLPLVICPKRSDIAMKCHLVRKFFSAPLRICL